LAYKDEYEVARMLSSAELLAELDKTFTRGGRYIFNLAPPIFGGRKISGRQRKRAFDARLMRPIFALMAKGKAVRGSPLDPFGWSTERRMERQLIVDYETLVQDVLRNLSAANHTAGVRLLTLVDSVRGFGPVKEAAIAAYQCAVIDAKAMFTGALAAQTGQAATAP
jgi:indolepyruvate ferredoxin oxidoreductase